jgi:hypothetical protein
LRARSPASSRWQNSNLILRRVLEDRSVPRSLQLRSKQNVVGSAANIDRQSFSRVSISSLPAIRLQPKLTVNQPRDAYEQEADRVADHVMRMQDPGGVAGPTVSLGSGAVQRECACGGTCDRCKKENAAKETMRMRNPGARMSPTVSLRAAGVQRACACGTCAECRADKVSEEIMRMHDTGAAAGPAVSLGSAGGIEAPPIVHEVLRSPGQPLDKATRDFMEPRFGQDFSGVRVHTDRKAADSAKVVGARAYTVGKDVVFASNQFSPARVEGRSLLAHELVHTIQQTEKASPASERLRGFGREEEPEEGNTPRLGAPAVTKSPPQVAMSPEPGCVLCTAAKSSSAQFKPDALRFAATKQEVTDKALTSWAVSHLSEGRSVQWLTQNLLSSHEFEGSPAARENAVEGLAFLLLEPRLKNALTAGADVNRARTEQWRLEREAERKEYINRGHRVAPKDAKLIMPEDLWKYDLTGRQCSYVYPEICAGNGAGDYEILGLDGGLVIFRKLKMFYYQMGIDDFARNIGQMGMVASGVWEGSKGVLYAGALGAQMAGKIGSMLPTGQITNFAFRGLEKAGSGGLEELDRMEAVRLGYEPHEKTDIEKLEEFADDFDPSILGFGIPGPHEGGVGTPRGGRKTRRGSRPSEHESGADGGSSLHEEGSSLAAGHGERGGDKPATKTGAESVKENVVHEAARQNDSEVIIDGRKHGISVYSEGKKADLEFCGPCAPVAAKLKHILDGLPENYNPKIKNDLLFLYRTAVGVEKDLAKGIGNDVTRGITKEGAGRLSRSIAKQLNIYIKQDPNLGKMLEMSPADLKANRDRLRTSLSVEGTPSPAPAPTGSKPAEPTRLKPDPVTARPKGTPSAHDVDILSQPGARKQYTAYPSAHQHHLFPQEFKSWFDKKFGGIHDIHEYTVYISEGEHGAIHASGKGKVVRNVQEPDLTGWNKDWKTFIDTHGTATPQQIFEEAGRLMDKYKISQAQIARYRGNKLKR